MTVTEVYQSLLCAGYSHNVAYGNAVAIVRFETNRQEN